MDESFLSSDESDEEFRQMEKDVDDFLASIRKDVRKTSEPQGEASCSEINNDYDCISSDDFEESDFQLLNVKGHDLDFSSNSDGKSFDASFSRNNRRGWRPWKWRGRGVYKMRRGYQGEHYNNRGRSRQNYCSKPWYEYKQHTKQSLSRRDNYLQRSIHCRDDDKYSWDEFDHETSRSPSENTSYHRMVSPRERYENGEWISPSEGRSRHQEKMAHSRGTHKSKRTLYQRICNERSYSSNSWSEKQANYYDYRDGPSNQYWKHEDDPLMENDDFQGSLSESMSSISVITACLEKAIKTNPEIAQKLSTARMFLLNKFVDRTCDDYEFEENSCNKFVDESGRASPRNWRNSRSPSFSKSLGSSTESSEPRHYKNRYETNSKRTVVYHSSSSSEENHYSPNNKVKEVSHSPDHDKQRTAASTSQTFSTRKGSTTKHHKNCYEEDPKSTVLHSMRKIHKQCEEETDSVVRRTLLGLFGIHQREWKMYLRKPEAHPDYKKEYRAFVNEKSKSITDLGDDPNNFDFQQDWKRYWPTQINRLFKESWDAKKLKCTSMLQRRGHLSKSLYASSEKDAINPPPKKKQKTSKCGNEKKVEVKSSEKQEGLQTASTEQSIVNKEEMDDKLISILRLLNLIKHKFQGCEASFDIFYQRALSLKEKKLDLCDTLQDNLPLLEKINASLKETLEDKNLPVVRKDIIQEIHERFKRFLKKTKEIKSKEINSGTKKNKENTLGETTKTVEVLCKEVQICKDLKVTGKSIETFMSSARIADESATDLHPPVITSEQDMTDASSGCCDSKKQISHSVRTLNVVSTHGTSCIASNATKQTKDGSKSQSYLPSPKTQHGKFTCKSTSMEKDTDIIQPPSPGVIPPPSDVNASLPGLIPTHSDVNLLSTCVTPPPGLTQAPCIGSPPASCVNPSTTDVTLPPTANVTSLTHTSVTPTTTITSPLP